MKDAQLQVSKVHSKGLRREDSLRFVELWKWQEQHPGETPKKVVQQAVGGKLLDGVWERIGESGVHHFKKYEDDGASKTLVLDDGSGKPQAACVASNSPIVSNTLYSNHERERQVIGDVFRETSVLI